MVHLLLLANNQLQTNTNLMKTDTKNLTFVDGVDGLALLGDTHVLRSHHELSQTGVQSESLHPMAVGQHQFRGTAVGAIAGTDDLKNKKKFKII